MKTCGAEASSAACWKTPGTNRRKTPIPGRNPPPMRRTKPPILKSALRKAYRYLSTGHAMSGISLILRLNEVAGTHGIGRLDMIENRLVGIKSREIYEAPAGIVLTQAHMALEALTLSKAQLRFKQKVAMEYSDIVYNGLWFSGQHQDLTAYIASTQRFVSGTVRLKLFKGSCKVVGRKSPHSLYSHSLATYDEGDLFDQGAAAGVHTPVGAACQDAGAVAETARMVNKAKEAI